MRTRILTAVAVGVLAAFGTRFLRGYPWELALASGVLLSGLTFVSLQTLVRLRATLGQFTKNR